MPKLSAVLVVWHQMTNAFRELRLVAIRFNGEERTKRSTHRRRHIVRNGRVELSVEQRLFGAATSRNAIADDRFRSGAAPAPSLFVFQRAKQRADDDTIQYHASDDPSGTLPAVDRQEPVAYWGEHERPDARAAHGDARREGSSLLEVEADHHYGGQVHQAEPDTCEQRQQTVCMYNS